MDTNTADKIRQEAKGAAALRVPLLDACRWPFGTAESHHFKTEYAMHCAALEALGMYDKPLTPD